MMIAPSCRSLGLLLLAGLGACDAAMPIAPDTLVGPARFQQGGASASKGEDVLVGAGRQFLDCIGETVRFSTSLPYRWHSTTTPDGKTTFAWMFIPGAGTGTATGLESGRVWTLDRAISPEVDHIWSDGSARFHWTSNFIWVSDGGPTLHLHTNIILEVGADGELTIVRLDARCKVR